MKRTIVYGPNASVRTIYRFEREEEARKVFPGKEIIRSTGPEFYVRFEGVHNAVLEEVPEE